MKQEYHHMSEEQQSTMAATSAKQENRQQQQDAALVQPSFDDHESRSHVPEKKSVDMGKTSREGHHRNLSEHFEDATRLTKGLLSESGQKHRREYSGDVSNPAQAHRRIDSTGGSTSIQRSRPHRRIDSTGLDALTAAADFSREELEAASQGRRQSWDQHSNLRRSPIETAKNFEHASHGSAPVPHPSPPHIASNIAHHRHYPPVNAPGGMQPRTVYYNHPSAYPPPPYPHSYHYPPHPSGSVAYGRHHGQPLHPPPPPNGYPVQYARPPHGQDPYMKQHHAAPLQQPSLTHPDSPTRRASQTVEAIEHKSSPPSAVNSGGMRPPPPPPHWPRAGSTQGVQTYITGIGAGETTRTLQPNAQHPPAPAPRSSPTGGHHRKLSSLSNLGPLFFGQDPSVPGGRHHRSTSSSMSFLNALDVNINDSADATFLRNLQESTGTPAAGYSTTKLQEKIEPPAKQSPSAAAQSKLMAGGTSKRVRRKCTVTGCENRVVQGGLCIAHGAKRKLCKHPGCKKHVKKAGLCSTHGPARKRCDVDNCNKVAVQGGRCIAHGAKKKLCSVDQCTKQAILAGMCKKHHDQKASGEEPAMCTVIPMKKKAKKPGHTRGLSIFQEVSADAIGDLLSPDTGKANPKTGTPTPAMV